MGRPNTMFEPIASKNPGIARHKPGARVFFSAWLRPAFDANTVVPTVTRHWRIERRRRHSHTGNLEKAVVDLPEHWLHLLQFVIAQHRIDPGDITVLRFESEVLMFQVSQALA